MAEDAGVVCGADAEKVTGEPDTVAGGRAVRERGVGTGNGAGSRATQFQSRHPGAVKAKRTGPGNAARKPCRLLRDMRFVYGHDESWDRTCGHEHCRRWLEQDLKGFLSKLGQLEAALASGK
jgi:hypothetical protein